MRTVLYHFWTERQYFRLLGKGLAQQHYFVGYGHGHATRVSYSEQSSHDDDHGSETLTFRVMGIRPSLRNGYVSGYTLFL